MKKKILIIVCYLVFFASNVFAGNYLSYIHAQNNLDIKNAKELIDEMASAEDDYILRKAFLMSLLDDEYDSAWKYLQQIKDEEFFVVFRLANLVKDGEYDKASSLIGDNSELKVVKAWVYVAQGNKRKAVSIIKELKGNSEWELKYLFHLGLIYDYFNENKKADKVFKKILDNHNIDFTIRSREGGSFVEDVSQGFAFAFFDLLDNRFAKYNWEGSLEYVKAASLFPSDNSDLSYISGEVNMKMMLFDKAIKDFEAVKKDSKMYFESQFAILEIMLSLGEVDKAVLYINSQMEKTFRTEKLLADIALTTGKYNEAVKHYTESLNLAYNADVNTSVVYFLRGQGFDKLGMKPRRDADWLKAIELDPASSSVMNYLGYSWLLEDRNISDAVVLLERSVFLSPNAANIDSLGWGYYKLGNYVKAEVLLEKASRLMPNDIEILGHLKIVYEAQGKTLKANYTDNHIKKLENNK